MPSKETYSLVYEVIVMLITIENWGLNRQNVTFNLTVEYNWRPSDIQKTLHFICLFISLFNIFF